jgi:hypothetical protein
MTDEEREDVLQTCIKSMFVRVTADHVEAGKSSRGGWSEEQFRLLGVAWPPEPGWKGRVIGQRISGSTLAAFIMLRDEHLSAK